MSGMKGSGQTPQKGTDVQGLYVDGLRPKTKKAVKEAIADDPSRVEIEATSWFGNEYDGLVSEAPADKYYWVGPDPHRSRKFYGSFEVTVDEDGTRKVVVS